MKNQKPSEVRRTILYQNDAFEIVSIEWSEATTSTLHDHGWSQCQVLVQEGAFENTLYAGAKEELRVLEVGQVLTTPVGALHEMRCLTKTGKTLHVYTPKIEAHNVQERKFCLDTDTDLSPLIGLGESVRFDELTEVLKKIESQCISVHSPFFMNQLFSGMHPQSILADEVIARTKATMATREASPIFSRIETEVVRRLCDLVGWAKEAQDGVAVPGGSAANFMALQLAKQKKCPETKTLGLKDHSFKIFVSQGAHYSFEKAALAMGFGTKAIVKVNTDTSGKMDAAHLADCIDSTKEEGHLPLLVCATAGTTVFGAFDAVAEIHEVTNRNKIWLHVDGAWGGPALFSKRAKGLIERIELADSITFDAHKLFGASLTCSFLLNKHYGLLLETNDVSGAEYLFHDSVDLDRGKLTWQCGRRADVLSFWSIWKNLGTEGLGDFVDRLLGERDSAMDWILKQPRLQVVKEPQFLNLCVRVLPPDLRDDRDWSKKVREKLKEKNLAMVNYDTDERGSFLRLIFAHPRITSAHVIQILNFALEIS